jgi:hypothetical protein
MRTLNLLFAVLLFVLFGFFIANVAMADLIPYNTYIASDWSDLHAKLDGKDGVTKHPDAAVSQPWGTVTYQGGGAVPSSTQLWIIANNDKQIVGELDMSSPGGYNFGDYGLGYGIYGDLSSTLTVDEGAASGESLIVAAEISGHYYAGSFTSGSLASGYTLTNEMCNIIVTNTEIGPVPEPGTMLLFGTGVIGVFGYVARRRMK